ncbi:1-hydroxy-2-methyl-2-butenyl 4-diphosphate reductase [Streptomyces sp. NRRL F-5135]|uniref:5'-methylthioadenosine/S-adenosylhomocysteine nucleosidase family protein n=1 Tax=Streptomyces sp. NRRL F-5135 TaxID=1463858 RepID=UPI00099D5D9F|nr:1-hydroxy-2-methyl-2-butenyl 4-diphosphate reductase [Streptomyces sp. NRRL F-5135]
MTGSAGPAGPGRGRAPGRAAGPGPRPSAGPPAGRPGPPLLIACALSIERLALRGGDDERTAAGPVTVLRTGMGPRNAARAVSRALARPAARDAAVIASGFCAGLEPGMSPGDLIVADETRGPDGRTACTGTATLVEALAAILPGRTVHTGPLTGSDHVVRGRERVALRATGALAADMESAATLHSALSAGPRPVAAVRVVVDAPEHELVRIGTVRGGISAFRVLRSVLPAFHEWHRSSTLPRR